MLITLSLIAFASCEKVVEFNADTTESKLVMISNPQADSIVQVRLSYSRFFLDNSSFKTEDHATMTLSVNGTVQYSPTNVHTGIYSFNYRPQPGDTLTLRATVAGREPIVAGTRVPNRPIVTVADSAEWETTDNYGTSLKIKFHLNDPAAQHNYYRLRIYHIDTIVYQQIYYPDTTTHTDTAFLAEYSSFNCSDALIVGQTDIVSTIDGETGTTSSDLLFTDANINGTNHEISINVSYGTYFYNTSTAKQHYFVVVESLSRDRYLYLQTCQSSKDDMSYFSEPTQIHCNVVGGIGSFAASSGVMKEVAIPTNNSSGYSESHNRKVIVHSNRTNRRHH